MTIPVTASWCPDCEEVCEGHPTMCTVCGAALTTPPSTTNRDTPSTTTARTRPIPDSVTNQLRMSSSELRAELVLIRIELGEIRNEQENMRRFLQSRREWTERVNRDLNAVTDETESISPSSATSTAFLAALPRIQFSSDNNIFQHCLFELDVVETSAPNTHISNKHRIPAIPGEFCKWSKMSNDDSDKAAQHRRHMSNLTLVIAEGTGTGEGGRLSDRTLQTIQTLTQQHRSRVALYMIRGGGQSFVQKAKLCQEAGASICVIGNHLPDGPWPYTMCDSTNEALTLGLTIPTVMISYAHGKLVQQLYREQVKIEKFITGSLIVQSEDHLECCICTESYSTGCEMIQIKPGCGHYFHKECVSQWLSQHNTCPFCRYALPFEDVNMERRRQRQLDLDRSGTDESDAFYG